jgi:winged helix-turn-helix DNA-binding protein
MKTKRKKWSDPHPIRFLNTVKILNLLKENWTTGLKQNEIMERTNLSKPTVDSILEELLSQHKIFKLNNVYFPEFDDDFRFGYFLSDYINFLLSKIMEKKQTISDPSRDTILNFKSINGFVILYRKWA